MPIQALPDGPIGPAKNILSPIGYLWPVVDSTEQPLPWGVRFSKRSYRTSAMEPLHGLVVLCMLAAFARSISAEAPKTSRPAKGQNFSCKKKEQKHRKAGQCCGRCLNMTRVLACLLGETKRQKHYRISATRVKSRRSDPVLVQMP